MKRFALIGIFVALPAFADDEFRTPATAVKADEVAAAVERIPGSLGVRVEADAKGAPVVADVLPTSTSGLKAGDVLRKLDGKDVITVDAFRTALRAKTVGERITVSVTRQSKPLDLVSVLAPASRPMAAVRTQASLLGIDVAAVKEGEGVTIEQVVPGSVAEKAKLKVGETIYAIDSTKISGPDKLREVMSGKKPDETIALTMLLAEKRVEFNVKLTVQPETPLRGGNWNRNRYWTKDKYRIAIILVEYPDTKHNAKIEPSAWADAMFSQGGTYKKTATGDTAHGSMHDYYWEQSYGGLKIEGKAFEYLPMTKNRMEYNTGNRTALLQEAMDKLLARDGKDALKDFDGVFFIYAGGRTNAARGSLYWPHKSNFSHNGKSWPYFICPEGGERMANISVFCHEFGHMLGMPDLYARPENPGMEGAGIWCAMANQAGQGRPQHFSAWCKDKLGWIKPTTIDPTVPQKLILAPIEDGKDQCFKVLLKPDGSEYLLLENRKQKGFDASLPASGLLIWRVVGNRPVLEESHGVAGPSGPRQFMTSVPYPSSANDSFTPFTTPSSRAQLGAGLPVYITNIKKRPDGKVTFHIGYEYQ